MNTNQTRNKNRKRMLGELKIAPNVMFSDGVTKYIQVIDSRDQRRNSQGKMNICYSISVLEEKNPK